jgi:hypothetical protein
MFVSDGTKIVREEIVHMFEIWEADRKSNFHLGLGRGQNSPKWLDGT